MTYTSSYNNALYCFDELIIFIHNTHYCRYHKSLDCLETYSNYIATSTDYSVAHAMTKVFKISSRKQKNIQALLT